MTTIRRTRMGPALAASLFFAATVPAHADSPAGLELGAQVASATCSDGAAAVEIDVAVTAGSAAPVTFHVSTGGAPFTDAGTSHDWMSHGPTKAMEVTLVVYRPASGRGALTWICAAQPGSNGNDSRSACAAVLDPGVLCSGGGGGPL